MALEPLTGRLQGLLLPVLAGGDISCMFNTCTLNGLLFIDLKRSALIALSCPSLRALKALYGREMLVFPFQCGVKGLANPCAAVRWQTG